MVPSFVDAGVSNIISSHFQTLANLCIPMSRSSNQKNFFKISNKPGFPESIILEDGEDVGAPCSLTKFAEMENIRFV